MKVQDVMQYLSSNVPFQYYPNEFPDMSRQDCGVVRMEDGGVPNIYIVKLSSPSVQVLIRHESGQEAERVSYDIWNHFHGKEHFQIGLTQVAFSQCNQSQPVFLRTDNNGRTIYSVNITFQTKV